MKRRKLAAIFGIYAGMVLIGAALLGASSIGPWPITGNLPVQHISGGLVGSGSFSITGTAPFYLSSNGTVATSTACNWVMLSVGTSAAKLSTTGSGALAIPSGLGPVTLSCSNLNTLQVTGTNAAIGYLYGN